MYCRNNNVIYGLIVSHMQKNSRKNIGNFNNICGNVNMLIKYNELIGNKNIYMSRLLSDKLGPIDDCIRTDNHYLFDSEYSSFNSYVHDKLQKSEINNVILTGIETQWCIMQTAKDFISKGYIVHVPVDATGTYSDFEHKIALDRLKTYGVNVCTTKGIISESLVLPHGGENNEVTKWFVDLCKKIEVDEAEQ